MMARHKRDKDGCKCAIMCVDGDSLVHRHRGTVKQGKKGINTAYISTRLRNRVTPYSKSRDFDP